MACACSKGRAAAAPVTGFAIQTVPEKPKPFRLVREDGTTQDFPNRIAAYTAMITEGGRGSIEPIEDASA